MMSISEQLAMEHSKQPKNDLEQARQIVEQHLSLDTCVITLNEKCSRTASGVTLSGGNEQDYPSLLEISRGLINVNQVQTINKTPLPSEILQHIKHVNSNCMMGIFQEVNRVWLTVDSDIYLWPFDKSGEVRFFSCTGETILAVGLVKPSPKVFTSCVKYLLIISTITETFFIGIACEEKDKENSALTFIPEPIFTLSNEGAIITVVATTESGRVFLGGKDGNLYEVIYKSESSWFGKRFKRINHHASRLSFLIPTIITLMVETDPIASISIDEHRNILYCLTKHSSIEVFDLGENGDETKSVAKISYSQISRCAKSVLPVINESLYQNIVEVLPLSPEECNTYHMAAMTASGVRLYFTTGLDKGRPFKLQMVHIRLPPGYGPRSPYTRPAEVHTALYKKGNYMVFTTDNQDSDSLWCFSIDNFPFNSQLVESVTRFPLEGPTWAVAELKHYEDEMGVLKDPIMSSAPMVVTQHLQSPRRWVLLSANGCHIISLLRPVDLLRQLLINNHGAANEAVKFYFESQPEAQACATCLVLACLESQSSLQVMEWATQAFFLYGGCPYLANSGPQNDLTTMNQTARPNENTFLPHLASTPMHGPGFQQYRDLRFPSPSSQQTVSPRNTSFAMHQDNRKMIDSSLVHYSHKHIGLNLYFSRILRPLWNTRCVRRIVLETGRPTILSVLTNEDCDIILHHLYTLGQFLNKHMSITGLKNDGVISSVKAASENVDPFLQEKTQLEMLVKFLAHVCEVLNLWKILIEHRFHTIASEVSEDVQILMLEFTFKDLFVLGHTICVALIISLINSYLSNNADVENITTRLRKLCPTFYRSEDAACSKANEILLKIIADNKKPTREIHPDDRADMIQLALNLCKKVVPDIPLNLVCPQFAAAEGYYALVDLCVASAKAFDPNGIALSHYKNKEPQEDVQGAMVLSTRMKMYREIINTLDHLAQFTDEPCAEQLPNANKYMDHIIALSLQHDDELLHISLYDWLLTRDMLGDVIPHAAPSLAAYLEIVLSRKPENVRVCELLYKYYETKGEHETAAKLLYDLAVSPNINMVLSERIRYMGRAAMSLRNGRSQTSGGLFLRDMEDKIEVAMVQQRVVDNVMARRANVPDAEEVVCTLNGRLFDVSQLYQDFAEPLCLHEAKLALLKCSDHNDQRLIESVWSSVIEQRLQQAANMPEQQQMKQVLINVGPLIAQYRSSPNCLPLVSITRQLEILCCRTAADCSLVSSTLLQSGILFENVYETYQNILHSNDRCWIHEGNELYFLQACAEVVKRFFEQKNNLSHKIRIKMTNSLQDFISSCISSVMSISATQSQELVQQFRSLQAQLNR